MLGEGFRWQVRDGRCVKFREDCWGFYGLCRDTLLRLNVDDELTLVRDLWLHDARAWDEKRVCDLYGSFLYKKVYELPILKDAPSDCIIWFHASNGCYSTKSEYA